MLYKLTSLQDYKCAQMTLAISMLKNLYVAYYNARLSCEVSQCATLNIIK